MTSQERLQRVCPPESGAPGSRGLDLAWQPNSYNSLKGGYHARSGTSAAFLMQLRERYSGPLKVIWDNAPAHRGEAVRECLAAPGLGIQLMNLPGYSPDFNADEAVWGWAREEATGNLCLGTRALVQDRVNNFLSGLASRRDEVKRRCRTVLQSRAGRLPRNLRPDSPRPEIAHPTLAWSPSTLRGEHHH